LERVFGKYDPSVKGYKVNGVTVSYSKFLSIKGGLPTFEYGYVVNGHKVQGSSYEHTLVDEGNILNAPITNKEANNSVYTAVSRPKQTLGIYNSMNPDQNDVNNVSAEEVINIEGTFTNPFEETVVPTIFEADPTKIVTDAISRKDNNGFTVDSSNIKRNCE